MKVQTVCRFCDQECPILAELDDDGKVIGISHAEITKGRFCSNGCNAMEFLHNPERLKKPLIAEREEDGTKRFREASWNEALTFTAGKLLETREKAGADSIMTISGFNKPLQRAAYQRFCNAAGIVNRAGCGYMCHQVQRVAMLHTFGTSLKPDLSEKTKTIVLWGSNPANTMRWVSAQLWETVKKGARLIFVDAIPATYGPKADCWLPIKPGTDLALALGMLHIIFREGWQDEGFLQQNCTGYEALKESVKEMVPERTAKICGLREEDIRRAAEWIAAEGPTAFVIGNALHHNTDSYQKCRALMLLMAASGSVDIEGGMLKAPEPSPRNLTNGTELHGKEFFDQEAHKRRIGCGESGIKEFSLVSGNDAVGAMLDGRIRAALVCGSDPVVQWADSLHTAEALGRLDFLAVVDFFLTPTAMQADVVLPAAMYLEYDSVSIDKDDNLRFCPALCSEYDVLPDIEIFRRLAEKIGVGDAFWPSMEAYWDLLTAPYGLTFAELKNRGYVETPYRTKALTVQGYRVKGFPVADGKVQLALTDHDRLAPLPKYEPLVGAGEEYPLLATTFKPGAFFGSAGQQNNGQRKRQPEAIVFLSCELAKRYGVADGDRIRISTPTGSCVQIAKTVPRMAEETVALSNARWIPESEDWRDQLSPCANNIFSRTENIGTEMPSFSCRGTACRIEKL